MNTLFSLKQVPAYQNKMFATPDAARACPTGDVTLAQDGVTGIVSNVSYDPDLLKYDETYQNEQGESSLFRKHLGEVLGKIRAAFGSADVLEVGCGKGLFVELMRGSGMAARGVDNAYEGDAGYIEKRHFGTRPETGAAAIVLRHVLEHIPDPVRFLRMIANANHRRGQIYIEVPCFEWIMRNRAWFDVFYEHVNYFRESDFHRIFERVVESGHLFGGQYLYAIADLASLRGMDPIREDKVVQFPEDFSEKLDKLATDAAAAPQRHRVIWGGAAKGVMFAYHLLQRNVQFDGVIDINPGKQGKYLATTGLPVLSPERALWDLPTGSDIYVMNSNYLREITTMGGPNFNYITVDRS